ncbi:helix-turn-helix domain-containing protein [Pukyongiella litopenaei]|uniref:Transcriptional regulator n=1 Tax=Pukyongiella litopenaei TaxID=2605946 RepID=A0A5C2H7G4_9RHOB|nr:transcriptional regulator [Pukyongiella litopenaei]QEP30663.1 transcriptional regulator [Pukyongiella litopenaei]
MQTFGAELLQSLAEAVAHAKGQGPATIHHPIDPQQVRKKTALSQEQVALLMGMSLSDYREWEQDPHNISGPAAILLRVIEKDPDAVRRALE